MSKLEVVYRRFFQFWLIFLNKIISHAQEYNFKMMLTSHIFPEEEKIPYLQKFAQNIMNNNRGP